MTQQIKNLLIGMFVIAACTFIISIILFLRPSVGDGKKIFHVRFSNIGGITVGTRVLFAGMPVGEVDSIEEIYDARTQPAALDGDVYAFQLTLRVDSSVRIYTTDVVAIQTAGLLGEKAIEITPKLAPAGTKSIEITTQVLYAESEDPIQRTVEQISTLAENVGSAVADIQEWFRENRTNISFAVQSFGSAMDQIYATVLEINQQHLIDDFQTAVQNFTSTLRYIQDAMQQLENTDTFTNVGIAVQHLRNTSESIDTIAGDIAAGKGTLGRLVRSDDMYLRFTAILSQISTLLKDVNEFGFLFHLNKCWQRTHLQRIKQINALKSPQDFSNYLRTESDQINTTMSRVAGLIDQADRSTKQEEILQNPQFQKNFAELLRQVETMRNQLEMYNQVRIAQ